MHIPQDFSFFKELYRSELLSIQIEGGAYDPVNHTFVDVEALRFNLRIDSKIKTLKIYYECNWFECYSEYDDYNGEYASCIGKMVEPNSDYLFLSTKSIELQGLCAELEDCYSNDLEDFATYCNLFFDFEEFPLEVKFDLQNKKTTVSSKEVLIDAYTENTPELREIRKDGTLGF
ncbi:hypothetical protein [Alteromonas sp. CyTr2]|mgnify:CR=1 FL=1|uniref:hypothetical protein n=1 Tax=Alteromonas sp. CyTr2 TaxID=2935039 RepID=UPI00248F2873|nr:hypothetical protein [Alteromonas sp. CyTr2]|tara:strand:+ start:1064 stop:1588 length:525 start_codon:yes stop_codon:yes gene_type:complete